MRLSACARHRAMASACLNYALADGALCCCSLSASRSLPHHRLRGVRSRQMWWHLVVGDGFSLSLSGGHHPRLHHQGVTHASLSPPFAFSSSSSSSSSTAASWQSLKQPVLKTVIGLGISVVVAIAVVRLRVLLFLPLPFLIGFLVYSSSSTRARFHYRLRPLLSVVIAYTEKALNSFVAFLESTTSGQKQRQYELEHYGGDDSISLDQRTKSEEMEFVLSEVRKCVDKLESVIAREDGSITHDNTVLSEIKETLYSLRALMSEYVAGRDMQGFSSSQFVLAVKELGRQSSKVLQLLHPADEAQGNNDFPSINGFSSKEGEIKEAETREKHYKSQTTSSDKRPTLELSGGNGALNSSSALYPTVDLSDSGGQYIELKSKPVIDDRSARPSEPQAHHKGQSNLLASSSARESSGDGTGLSPSSTPISADERVTRTDSEQNVVKRGKESAPQSSTNNIEAMPSMKLAEEGYQEFGTEPSGSGSFKNTLNTFSGRLRGADGGSGLEIGDEKHRSTRKAPQKEEASDRRRRTGSLPANLTNVKVESEGMQDKEELLTSGRVSKNRNGDKLQVLMKEGESLFRKGKSGLAGDLEVGEAETMLYRAADKFASAAAIDPSSIEAIGLWGNTLLVHGELKLKLSRELRRMLSYPVVTPTPYQASQSEVLTKSKQDSILQTLQSVCEECEQLLVGAGRKYRMALSVDKSDFRALYNWGLALCFRAQLISAEEGQDAKEAADRIYLAAVDKFEAMMGISQKAAPGAMLNWGLVLRDRSRLRPVSSEERINLLQQANQLLEDAARLHPNDPQIRGALATCSVELEELEERNRAQSGRGQRPAT